MFCQNERDTWPTRWNEKEPGEPVVTRWDHWCTRVARRSGQWWGSGYPGNGVVATRCGPWGYHVVLLRVVPVVSETDYFREMSKLGISVKSRKSQKSLEKYVIERRIAYETVTSDWWGSRFGKERVSFDSLVIKISSVRSDWPGSWFTRELTKPGKHWETRKCQNWSKSGSRPVRNDRKQCLLTTPFMDTTDTAADQKRHPYCGILTTFSWNIDKFTKMGHKRALKPPKSS